VGERANVSELVDVAAGRDASGIALVTPGGPVTYEALAHDVERAARGFAALGVAPGDRLLVEMPNLPRSIALWLGLARVGAVLVPANPAATDGELGLLVQRARPTLIVGASSRNELGRTLDPDAVLAAGDGAPPPPRRADAADPVAFIPTSGTTSAPKLVVQTHRSFLLAAEAFPWWLGLTADDRLMTALPLFHLNALVYSTLAALDVGAPLVLLERFSATTFWADAVRFGATEFNAIGAMVEILMRQPPVPEERQHSVRLCYTAPALPRPRHDAIEERFGLRAVVGYGMSETPFGTVWPVDGARPYGTMGHLRQHPRLGTINRGRVVDAEDRDVPQGEMGELPLDNPGVMLGYFEQPDETGLALRGGWLHTGDLVTLDGDGNYTHVGRSKEMIRRRGENISPAEIEEVLLAHPGVAAAAVVGVPSPLSDEDVVAFVIPSGATPPADDELREWCRRRLARSKVPEVFVFVDDFPMTPTNRVAKHELRNTFIARHAGPRP
jgi:crotonobetaine/carnitine-CoA ligase